MDRRDFAVLSCSEKILVPGVASASSAAYSATTVIWPALLIGSWNSRDWVNSRNLYEASRSFVCSVMTMDSPPTTEIDPPSPAGTFE